MKKLKKFISISASESIIKESWDQKYDLTFCWLKPFYISNNKNWFFNLETDTIPQRNDFLKNNHPIKWQDLGFKIGLDSARDFANKMGEILKNDGYLFKNKIILPPLFDYLEPTQITEFSDFLLDLNYLEFLLIDEILIDSNIKKILNNKIDIENNYLGYNSILTLDGKISLKTGFDYHNYCFVCGTEKFITSFANKSEGFICDENSTTWNPLPLFRICDAGT